MTTMLTQLRETMLRAGLAYGAERWERVLLARHIPPDMDVVELGASVGGLAETAVRRMVRGARYVGVEIDDRLLPIANRRIAEAARESKAAWRVLCGAVGVWPHERVGVYRPGPSEGGGAMQGNEAPGLRLTDVLEQGDIAGDYALVCDIEGSECGVWAHDTDALQRCRIIVAELHDCSAPTYANPDAMPITRQLARLADVGFRVLDKGVGRSTVYAFTRN
jgi:hypothetical protein